MRFRKRVQPPIFRSRNPDHNPLTALQSDGSAVESARSAGHL